MTLNLLSSCYEYLISYENAFTSRCMQTIYTSVQVAGDRNLKINKMKIVTSQYVSDLNGVRGQQTTSLEILTPHAQSSVLQRHLLVAGPVYQQSMGHSIIPWQMDVATDFVLEYESKTFDMLETPDRR